MIFPSLQGKKLGYINLNLEAKRWMTMQKVEVRKYKQNPLLDPVFCQEMVHAVHIKYGLDFSYGGWMEDRSFLWKGSYLDKEKNFVHLGVDLNVPSGTEIAISFKAEVVKIDDDYPEDGGWGPRIIVKHLSRPVYFIFAHLDRGISCQNGDILKVGDVFAKVGKAPQNGNWFPHLHVQTISAEYYAELERTNTWSELDGYGIKNEIALNATRFQDPLPFITLH